MSHDVISDAMNMIRNAHRAGNEEVKIRRISNMLIEILKIMKRAGAIKKYKIDSKEKSVEVTVGDLIECKAIKPRFTVGKDEIEKYKRRYLPSRDVGTMIISTNSGLKTHEEAEQEGTGGGLIAFFY